MDPDKGSEKQIICPTISETMFCINLQAMKREENKNAKILIFSE